MLVSPENADKLHAVLVDLGFGEAGITREDFLDAEQVIQLGRAPNRIDILTGICGVTWQVAWASRTQADLDGLKIQVIGRTVLIQSKQTAGRPQDLANLARLRQVKR